MKVIAGLGNPGPEYCRTRHNLGFRVLDHLAGVWGVTLKQEAPGKNWIGRCDRFEEPLLLAKPGSYMNASGVAIGQILHRHRLGPKDLIVVVDDVSLPLGSLRVRPRGSAGGHNGLASICRQIETQEFVRIRLGIDSPARGGQDLSEFVLSDFRPAQEKLVAKVVKQAQEALECLIQEGISKAMSLYNKSPLPPLC